MKKLTALLALILALFVATSKRIRYEWRIMSFEYRICAVLIVLALAAIITTRAGGWLS